MPKEKSVALKPLHFAAALLDPLNQGSNLTPEQQIDTIEFIYKVATDMKIDSLENIMTDLAKYRSKYKLWSKNFLWSCSLSTSPVSWWKRLCGTSLSKVAIRILTITVSSAERLYTYITLGNIRKINFASNKSEQESKQSSSCSAQVSHTDTDIIDLENQSSASTCTLMNDSERPGTEINNVVTSLIDMDWITRN